MLNSDWYDKIASAAADAEAAVLDAAAQEAAAEDQGLIEKIEEDIQIAQEVAATDLPTDVKVEILVEQGVDENIIDEVIDADATDAVAAYYGVDPYWLHDKRANASFPDKLAARYPLTAGMLTPETAMAIAENADGSINLGNFVRNSVNDGIPRTAQDVLIANTKHNETQKALNGLFGKGSDWGLGFKSGVMEGQMGMQPRVAKLRRNLKTVKQHLANSEMNRANAVKELLATQKDLTAMTGLRDAAVKSRNLWRGGAIGAGVLGAGAAGYLGYKLYKQQQAQAAAEAENARQAGIIAGLSADNSNMVNAGYGALGGAGLGALAGAGIGYALDGGQGALTGGLAGGLGGAALGGLGGYNYTRGRAAMGI